MSKNFSTFVGYFECIIMLVVFFQRNQSTEMKSFRFTFFAFLAVALGVTSCKESPYINSPGDNGNNLDAIPTAPIPTGIDIPDSAITVAEARQICSQLASGATTPEKYYVKGWVQNVADGHADAVSGYGNGLFYMADISTGTSTRTFYAYQVMGKDGKRLPAPEAVAAGDYVVIYGNLTNYNGIYETTGRGAAQIYSSTNDIFNGKIDTTLITPDPEGADVPEGTLTVYQANAICDTLANGQSTPTEVYIKGYVRKNSTDKATIEKYGNANFTIAPTIDASSYSTFYIYQVYGKNKQRLTNLDQVKEGDFVVVCGKLTNYNGTYETVGRGASYIYYSNNPNW